MEALPFRPQSGYSRHMTAEIKSIQPIHIACMEHHGNYTQIGKTFDRLFQWVNAESIPFRGMLAVYYDDPHTTPEAELRSQAGVVVDEGFTSSNPEVTTATVPGGEYAVAVHFGPYDTLPKAWEQFFTEAIPKTGRRTAPTLCFEMYMNDCTKVPQDEVRTDLYAPLE